MIPLAYVSEVRGREILPSRAADADYVSEPTQVTDLELSITYHPLPPVKALSSPQQQQVTTASITAFTFITPTPRPIGEHVDHKQQCFAIARDADRVSCATDKGPSLIDLTFLHGRGVESADPSFFSLDASEPIHERLEGRMGSGVVYCTLS